jgi:site-specific DNA-methyltransferase (adenine-specific)
MINSYYENENGKLYHENCLDIMKEMEENSIDMVCIDPPYGYNFMGKDWDKSLPDKKVFVELLRILKPGSFACIMSAPRTDVYWRMCQMIEEAGFKVDFTPIVWAYSSGFPKALNVGKMVDKKNGIEREILGVSPAQRLNKPENDIYEAGIRGKECFITKGISPLEGSYAGFQPKPACEFIIVTMKPLNENGYTEQALKNQKGISWMDDCRIPYINGENIREGNNEESKPAQIPAGCAGGTIKSGAGNINGRFPANLLVSDDSLNDGNIYKGQSGATTGEEPSTQIKGKIYGDYTNSKHPSHEPRNDIGSFSRYFDLDKWFDTQFCISSKASKSERNKGCEKLKEKNIAYSEYRDNFDITKSSVSKYPDGTDRPMNKTKNNHPCVKPIKLMSYLITMFSRENDVILDCFAGSGSTLLASQMINRKFIGIELNEEYCEISKCRLIDYDRQLKMF